MGSREFWTKVAARREANGEAVKINKLRGPLDCRPYYVARGQELARGLSAAECERARLDYLEWFKELRRGKSGVRWPYGHRIRLRNGGLVRKERYEGKAAYFWSELEDAKRKAYSRRRARFPYVPTEYDRDTAVGETAIPTPWDELGGASSWHEQEGFDLGQDDGDGFGVIVQGAIEIAREEWERFVVTGHPMPTIVPADQKLCARILAKSPGRKRGRPPINGKAMTDAERKQRQRAKEFV